MQNTNKANRLSTNDDPTERTLYDALRLGGELLPQNVEDVRRAEAELAECPIPVPVNFQDPYAVLDNADAHAPSILPLSLAANQTVNDLKELARAAREGGEITSEIEGRMKRDKAATRRNETGA